MRWLITGAGGMLAEDVLDSVALTGEPVLALGRPELDLLDRRAVRDFVSAYRPGVVVNCAGWTAVDAAETHEEEATAVNGAAVAWLAEVCARVGSRLLHVSTDYVFDGGSGRPYPEDAPTGPVNAYGRSKLAGEAGALEHGQYVVRTAWLYGARGPNFARTMIGLAGERRPVDVVDDQRGQPTWTADLAAFLVGLARSGLPPGVYHGTSSGETTWWGLAREIFALAGADPGLVRPVPTSAVTRPARRPAYGVLACTRCAPIRDWREALHAAWPALTGRLVAGADVKAGGQCGVP
ncbi:dTDP-4-dehydrorhamnose reductase [Nonomuraea pusilla]|uniref:dTDP-4-dehydrorhamnose reductase n=1 Tax=Nonomuraea pusilla TaxID=46177 RepID=A0A1H7R638_9ACTN|nr:dTDP-4-dehydrorhamnose reductase [Nonomuraea pusilla]SEL55653.1 dTDP-4-dehydrorhamnose reductase [Nonomuraea pusilla]